MRQPRACTRSLQSYIAHFRRRRLFPSIPSLPRNSEVCFLPYCKCRLPILCCESSNVQSGSSVKCVKCDYAARLGEGEWSYDILGRVKGKNAKETMEKYEEKYPGFAFLGMMMEFQAELQKKVKKGAISWTEDTVDGSPIYHFAFHFRRGSGNSQTVRTCQLHETRFLANEMFPKHPDRGGKIRPVQDQELRAELQVHYHLLCHTCCVVNFNVLLR